jgi:5,10-methylenetetrahydrofolate reductase
MARCGELGLLDHVWVIAGVFIPRSGPATRYLRDHVPGVDVPESLLERMEAGSPQDQRRDGIEIALEIVDHVRQIPGVSGVHLMTINNEEAIPTVLEEARLLPRPVEARPSSA